MVFATLITPSLFSAVVISAVLSTTVYAQTTTPPSDQGRTEAMPYRSSFEGYRAWADAPIANWKAANDTTAQIGGWREYAKQAQSEEAAPARRAEPEAKPTSKVAP